MPRLLSRDNYRTTSQVRLGGTSGGQNSGVQRLAARPGHAAAQLPVAEERFVNIRLEPQPAAKLTPTPATGTTSGPRRLGVYGVIGKAPTAGTVTSGRLRTITVNHRQHKITPDASSRQPLPNVVNGHEAISQTING